jgi:hypothetical protein
MVEKIKKIAAILCVLGFLIIVIGSVVNMFSPDLLVGGSEVRVIDLLDFLGWTMILASILMFGYSLYRYYVE